MDSMSVIVPAFNEARNLARFLPLVRAHLQPSDELIVVDNASTDATAAVAASLGAIVIREAVRGRSRARNAGIACARGELLAFVDADCFPEPGWLDRLRTPFDDPRVGCVAGEIITDNVTTALGQYLIAKGHLSQAINFRHSFLPFAATANVAYRRKVCEALNGFDDTLPSGEDADLCWRMQLHTAYKILLAPDAAVCHVDDPSWHAVLRQKRLHGYGSVLLYRKFRDHRGDRPPLKVVYWQYRSIARRAVSHLVRWLGARLRMCSPPPADHGYQLLLEIGEKLGRLEGCLRHRVWFP